MNDSQQSLESLLSKSQPNQFFSGIQDQMQFFLAISAAISFIIIVLLIVNLVYKWRVQSAILRMDKNLQKLVDNQKEPIKANSDEE